MELKMDHGHDHGCGCGSGHGHGHPPPGPKYCVNIAGTQHDWPKSTITTEEIAQLGGWPVADGVVMVMEYNSERTLKPGDIVHLQPGQGFCRKVRWKRGLSRGERITAEIALLKTTFPLLRQEAGWVVIPDVELPPGWSRRKTDVAFQIADTFPGTPPYGLYVPAGLRFNGQMPQNYTEPAGTHPPCGGTWGVFSWTVNDPAEWQPAATPEGGANLLRWARSFRTRFEEGA